MSKGVRLADYAEPDKTPTAHVILHDYIGEVAVVGQSDGVVGYVRLSGGAVYKFGAQERT